ncbi:hypothetical protein WR25_07564 [Diploscapter pachys]|uniref:RING-type domain-containing protein n=1 Tax=Diploscapter pachys TaxID=2018661 RepID=A0A2A2LQU4_9BILA|nr:hypothetical protein WR25_07564 [Diploscapter pachys]
MLAKSPWQLALHTRKPLSSKTHYDAVTISNMHFVDVPVKLVQKLGVDLVEGELLKVIVRDCPVPETVTHFEKTGIVFQQYGEDVGFHFYCEVTKPYIDSKQRYRAHNEYLGELYDPLHLLEDFLAMPVGFQIPIIFKSQSFNRTAQFQVAAVLVTSPDRQLLKEHLNLLEALKNREIAYKQLEDIRTKLHNELTLYKKNTCREIEELKKQLEKARNETCLEYRELNYRATVKIQEELKLRMSFQEALAYKNKENDILSETIVHLRSEIRRLEDDKERQQIQYNDQCVAREITFNKMVPAFITHVPCGSNDLFYNAILTEDFGDVPARTTVLIWTGNVQKMNVHLNLGDVIKVLEIRDMTCLRFLPTVHKVVVTGLGLFESFVEARIEPCGHLTLWDNDLGYISDPSRLVRDLPQSPTYLRVMFSIKRLPVGAEFCAVQVAHICLMNKMVQDLEHQVQIANALEQRSTMLEQQVRNLQTQNQGLREAMRREQDEVVPDEPQVLPNTPPKVQEEPAAGKCCTCLEALSTIVLMPCRHMVLCETCVNHYDFITCPMCRQDVHDKIKVFF